MKKECYQIFNVQTDQAQDYTIDKIIINQQQASQFLNILSEFQSIQTTGLYGSLVEVQKKLESSFQISMILDCYIQKGTIIGLTDNNKAIFCLILEDQFFVQKPIDEKNILLTLFRIFIDLVNNIHLCFNENIFKLWYEGRQIPFSDVNVMRRQQFVVDKSKNKQIEEKTININFNNLKGEQLQLYSQNMTMCMVLGSVHFQKVIEQQKNFESEYQNIAIQILQKYQTSSKSPSITSLLQQNSVLKSIKSEKLKENLELLSTSLQQKISQLKIDNKNNSMVNNNFLKSINPLLKALQGDLNLAFQDQVCFTYQKCQFKINRKNSSLQNEIEKISIINDGPLSTQMLNQQSQSCLPTFQITFRTKENNDIFIFYDSSNKQHQMFLLNQNQTTWKQLGAIQKSEQSVFYFNQKNNCLFCFNIMNNKQVTKNEINDKRIISQVIFCEQIDENQKEIIVAHVAYLQLTKKFVVLSKNKQIFTLCEQSKRFSFQQLTINKSSKLQTTKYEQLLSCPSGKYFYLSDYSSCDMFDCNFTLLKKISIQGRLIIISDNQDILILNMFERNNRRNENITVKILSNVIEQSSLNRVMNDDVRLEGNPAIDLMKGAQAKFGPLSLFLSQTMKKNIKLCIEDQSHLQKINNYLQQLNLYEFEIQQEISAQFQNGNLEQIKNIIYSRVPLQLCTIENGNFIPLIDGFRLDQIKSSNLQIIDVAQSLTLGYLEEYMMEIKEKIYVVSIIGKQSSGKSYLLNRIFGTRYSVAASRCTDGIWASLCRIEKQYFLIFDCEGLFSQSRSQKEEVQMLAFLTAISDITILNQDLTFNRYLTDLLENLASASQQLEGKTLFQGNLYIMIRDVSSRDNSGVDEELISSIQKQRSGENSEFIFLEKLFKGAFWLEKLVNFENKTFDDQIVELRYNFINEAQHHNHWIDGKSLIQTMKILLCQLEMSDKTNATLLQEQGKISLSIKSHKQKWKEFLEKEEKLINYGVSDGVENAVSEVPFFIESERNQINFSNKKYIQYYVQAQYLTFISLNHNEILDKIDQHVRKMLAEKGREITENFEEELCYDKQSNQSKEYIIAERTELRNYLTDQIENFSFCKKKCTCCYLQCTKYKIHYMQTEVNISQLQKEIQRLNKQLDETKIVIIQSDFDQQTKDLDFKIMQQQKNLKFFKICLQIQGKNNRLSQIKQKSEHFDFNKNQKNNKSFEKLKQLFQINQLELKEQKQLLDKSEQKLIAEEKNLLQKQKLFDQQIVDEDVSKKKLQDQKEKWEGQKKLILILNERIQQLNQEIAQCQMIELEETKIIIKSWQSWTTLFENNQSVTYFFKIFNKFSNILDQIENEINIKQRMKHNLNLQAQSISNKKSFQKTIAEIVSAINLLQQKKIEHYFIQIERIKEFELNERLSEDQIFKLFLDFQNNEQEVLNARCQNLQQQSEQQGLKQKENEIIKELKQCQDSLKSEQKNSAQFESAFNTCEQAWRKKYDSIQEFRISLERAKNSIQALKLKQQAAQNQLKLASKKEETIAKLIEALRIQCSSISQKYTINEIKMKKVFEQLKLLQQKENIPEYQENFQQQIQKSQQQLQEYQLKKQQILLDRDNLKQSQMELEKQIGETGQKLKLQQQNRDEHSCQRDSHYCDQMCCACTGQKCEFLAGHQGSHLCLKKEHLCLEKCQVQGCQKNCSKKIDHEDVHTCSNFHQCNVQCNFCLKLCNIDCLQNHVEHLCENKQCDQLCILCKAFCKEPHNHSKKDQNLHFCEKQEHQCQEICEQLGLCKINYQQTEQVWQTELTTFKYINYVQINPGKQKCIQIIKGSNCKHLNSHVCFQDSEVQYHTCDKKCPECLAFCTKKFGHIGEHSTHQHRNKENQQFTLEVGCSNTIEINETRKYKVGDSAQPETCSESCKRRGRSHFHLFECKGGKECLEKSSEYKYFARHSQVKYQGFETTQFDEVQCSKYWILQNWAHPVNHVTILEEISKCNFFCSSCGEDNKQYCNDQAWHSDSICYRDHQFPCLQNHKANKIQEMNICFVIDSTRSMDSYLRSSVQAIKQIMTKAKKYQNTMKECVSIQFAVVAYTDHPQKSSRNSFVSVFQKSNFTDYQTTCSFLDGMSTSSGGDVPEAVLDGLDAALQLNWNQSSFKILYLIADAPPHGCNASKTIVYHNVSDSFPDGCPCGLTQGPILKKMKTLGINFKILKLNSMLELTIAQFKKDYTELQVLDIQNRNDHFVPTIVDDVCQALKNNEITYQSKC